MDAVTSAQFEGILSYWILQTVAMLITAALLPGLRITGIFGATLTVGALALVNATVWDAALFVSVPDAPSTQALTLLALNGAIFWLLVKLLPGIETDGILPSLAAPLVFTVVSLLIDRYGRHIDWPALFQWVVGAVEGVRDTMLEAQSGDPGAASPAPGAADSAP